MTHSDPSASTARRPTPDGARRPLRVVIGCDTFAPDVNGAARFAERLAAGLTARGEEVHVVAPASSRRTAGRFVETVEGVPVHVVRLPSWRWYPHDWLRFVVPWFMRRRARRILDDVAPDVVHFQSHVIVGRGLAREAHARGVRVVGTNHIMPENILDFTLLPGPLNDLLMRIAWRDERHVFELADAVTTPTRRAADFLERNTGLRGVIPVSCGIRARDYAPDLGPRRDRRILFVGRLTREKQIDVALRAFDRLDPELDARFDVVGSGDQLDALRAQAAHLRARDRVTFHGRVDDAELRRLYSTASVFVMPSIAELQSIATLEAMASGLPVVAADAMALPHLVRPGENGYLFRPGDPVALADALDRVLRQTPERRLAMQRASLDGVRPHDIEHTLDTFEALYRGLTPPAPAPVPEARDTDRAHDTDRTEG